ncbi:MAG TPA: hypothetical protein VNV40_05060 [Steroidobacteraceae bacterium]|nr:hypothetical protein [Steroidobacteraceae bacterium]
MLLADAAGVADTVEELEDLHGALAAEADAVAEARGAHTAVLARARIDDTRELRDALAGVEEVVHHLVGATAGHLLAQHGAHALLALVHGGRELAHPGRIETPGQEQRLESLCEERIVRRKRGHVLRQMEPRSAAREPPLAEQRGDHRLPERRRRVGEAHPPQPPAIGSRLVRDFLMEAPERLERAGAQCLPAFREQHEALRARGDRECASREHDVVRGSARDSGELGDRHTVPGAGEQRADAFPGHQPLERAEAPLPLRRAAPPGWSRRVEHLSAADRVARARIAHDEPVAGHREHRRLEHELHRPPLAGGETRGLERHCVGEPVGGAKMHVQRRPGLELHSAPGEELEAHVEAGARPEQAWICEPVSALNGALFDTGEIQRAALPGAAELGRLVLRVDAAHARRAARRHDGEGVAGAHATREHGAGDDGAVP